MLGVDLGKGLFVINIDGIVVKFMWSNGVVFGMFNINGGMIFIIEIGCWIYLVNFFFRIELYKIKEIFFLSNIVG